MRVDAYLRAVGDEDTIRKLHAETAIPNASIKCLKAKSANGKFEWHWQTRTEEIGLDDADGELRALLLAHRSVSAIIKKYSGQADIYLEIVTRYAANDELTGLFLSPETVQLLGEFGAALDHDVVLESSQ